MKTYGSISADLRKKRREEKKKLSHLTHLLPSSPSHLAFIHLLLLLLLFWKHGSYFFIRVCFWLETIYFFLVHFILNELSPRHFLTSEIFIKISSLKSLTAYHSENRKIFCLSHNSMKLFGVTRFRETNLTVQSVSSSEI